MAKYLVGIDLGTSAVKVALFGLDGSIKASTSEAYPVYYPNPGWAEQNPDEWWSSVCIALRRTIEESGVYAKDIAGVGIDAQGWAAVAIDKEGNVLTNTPIWMDTRSTDICKRLNDKIGADKIFELCGNPLQPSYTTSKVVWYKENLPEVYEKTYKILQANSFLAYRLTGAISQDICQSYGWHCFNMHTGEWDYDMADAMGIPRSFLPEIVPCDKVIGQVTKEAAAQTRLFEGTPVVAGGLDAACGALGVGVLENGDTQEQGGQAGGMSICMDEYKSDPNLILSFHVVPGKWLLQGGSVGGSGVMRWFEKEFAAYERSREAELGESSLDQLNDIARVVNAGSDGLIFLPYMSGERSPIWNPKAKGVFYGLDFSKTKGHMVRACMEGTAYALKHNLEVAEAAGAEVKVLRAMGGAANSVLWTQIKSDITDKEIMVPGSDSATGLGAAILAGVGVGLYDSYEGAINSIIKEKRHHNPNEETRQVYDEEFETYKQIYQDLKGLMNK